MGLEVMWWAMRAEDGRGEPTALSTAVASYFGRETVSDVAIGIHLGEIDTDDLIRLTYVLFQVSDAGDSVAMRLVDRLADEVSAWPWSPCGDWTWYGRTPRWYSAAAC